MMKTAWFAVFAFAVFAGFCITNSFAQQGAMQLPQSEPSKELWVMLEEHPALPLGPYWLPDWLRGTLVAASVPPPPVGGSRPEVKPVPPHAAVIERYVGPPPLLPNPSLPVGELRLGAAPLPPNPPLLVGGSSPEVKPVPPHAAVIERYVGPPPVRLSLGEIGKKPVTLEVDRTEVSEAIMNLLEAAGASYVLGGDVPSGRRITARFKNVPLQDALDALAEAAGMYYTLKGNVIVLRPAGFLGVVAPPPPITISPPKAEPKPSQPKPQPQTKPQSNSGAGQKSSSLTEKSSTTTRHFALSRTSAADILQRLVSQGAVKLPPGIEAVAAAPDGSSIVARGTKDALQELQKTIALLETTAPGVRTLEVQASVFSISESGLKTALPERFLSQPEFVLGESEAEQVISKLKSSGAVALCQPVVRTLENQLAAVSVSEPQISLWVRPRVNPDRSVTLSLSFSNRKDPAQQAAAMLLAQSTAAGEAVPMHASQVIRRLEPGKVLFFMPPAANSEGDAGRTLVAVKARLVPRN